MITGKCTKKDGFEDAPLDGQREHGCTAARRDGPLQLVGSAVPAIWRCARNGKRFAAVYTPREARHVQTGDSSFRMPNVS